MGGCVEQILSEVSSPILTLSTKLELIRANMQAHKRMLKEHERGNQEEFEDMVREFDTCCKDVDRILKGYKIISELTHIGEEDREGLEKRLKKYNR